MFSEQYGVLRPEFCLSLTSKFSVIESRGDTYRASRELSIVFLDVNCQYSAQIIRAAIARRPWCRIVDSLEEIAEMKPSPGLSLLQIADFENIEWEKVLSGRFRASSYLVRKGLSRKAQLSLQIKKFVCKNPDTILRHSVPPTYVVETWDCFEDMRLNFGNQFASFNTSTVLQASLRKRLEFCLEDLKDVIQHPNHTDWTWILKPSVTNKGLDITVLRNWDGFLEWLEENPDTREWVLQRYIEGPLLVMGGYKFHLRVYVVSVGALTVYVYNNILMLIAAHRYDKDDLDDMFCHLTNTARACEDSSFDESKFVQLLDDLPSHLLLYYPDIVPTVEDAQRKIAGIKKKIYKITRDLFGAFENEYTVFCPMASCFEVYGLDFMVDSNFDVHLLEVNPGPDFKQTGGRLRTVIVQLWEQVCALVLDNEKDGTSCKNSDDMMLVYEKVWSASKLQGGMNLTDS